MAEQDQQVGQEEEFDYESEFNAQVAKREAEKAGAAREPTESEPTQEAASKEAAEPAGDQEEKQDKQEVKRLSDDELLAALPESQREAAKARLAADAEERRRLDNNNRSLAGRMAAYQRRYEEAAGKRPVEAAKAASAEDQSEWKQFADDYPDIAKAIEGRFRAGGGNTADVKALTEYVQEQRRERFLTEAYDAVEAVHPGWRDVAGTKEFQEWKGTSPTYEKLASSDDTADAIALFDLWNAYASAHGTADPEQAEQSERLSARREAQVAGARSVKSRTESPNHDVNLNDADQLFEFYAKKAEARMKRRYS